MRIGLLFSLAVALTLPACDEAPPAKDPSSASTKESKDGKPATPTASSGGGAGAKPEVTCSGKPGVGKGAAPFTLAAVNGGSKMAVDKGKVVLVDFWATWCEPCKKSFPKYQELYSKYKASGLEILAVSVDDEKKEIPDFIKNTGAKFPVGWDEGHKIAECYNPATMPTAFIIDKSGVVKYVHAGYKEGEDKAIEKEIKELL